MALNIPAPESGINSLLKGVSAGSDLMKTIMNPILQREINKQKAEQFKLTREQLENHFNREMAFKKSAASNGNENRALNKQLLLARIDALKNKDDPQALIRQLEALQGYSDKFNQPSVTTSKDMQSFIPGVSSTFGQQPSQQQETQPEQNLLSSLLSGNNQDNFGGNGLMQDASNYEQAQQELQQPEDNRLIPELNENAISEQQSQQKPKDIFGLTPEQLGQGLIANKFHVKSPMLRGSAGDSQAMEQLINTYGRNSDVVKRALAKDAATLKRKDDLSNKAERESMGLKTGETPIIDENTNEMIGKKSPLSAKEKEEFRGRGFFDYQYPVVSKGSAELSGKGSLGKFEHAVRTYKNNPASRELLINFYLAKKSVPALVAKEAQTLASGKQKSVIDTFTKSLETSDVPKKVESLIKQFRIGSDIQNEVDSRYHKMLTAATEAGHAAVPAFLSYYNDPFKQSKNMTSLKEKGDELLIELPKGITDAMIQSTMRQTGLTKNEIIKKYNEKHGGQ